MKTYADLTNEQLKELYRLALDTYDRDEYLSVVKDDNFVRVWLGEHASKRDCWMDLWLRDGQILIGSEWDTKSIENLWQVIALLKSWGVDYTPETKTV